MADRTADLPNRWSKTADPGARPSSGPDDRNKDDPGQKPAESRGKDDKATPVADEDTYSKAKMSAAAAKKAQAKKAPPPIASAPSPSDAGGAMPQAAGAMNATAAPPPMSPAQRLYGNTPTMSGAAGNRPMEGGSRA